MMDEGAWQRRRHHQHHLSNHGCVVLMTHALQCSQPCAHTPPPPCVASQCHVLLCAAGVGAGRGRDDEWVEQQAAFEEVLSQLHQQHPQGSGREGVCVCVCVCVRLSVCVFSTCVFCLCVVPLESLPSGEGGEGGPNCLTSLAAATRQLT